MREIDRTSRFRRDYKRERKTTPSLDDEFLPVLNLLLMDAELPAKLSDHPLGGSWVGYRDCHIRPDLVLIYAKTDDVLTLARIGSHAELFG